LLAHAFHSFVFLFLNYTATLDIYTLSLHDALPILDLRPRKTTLWRVFLELSGSKVAISFGLNPASLRSASSFLRQARHSPMVRGDRKSTRLNSSHEWISYAVFCLKKKKKIVHTR